MLSWLERHNKVSWTITILGAMAIFFISSLTLSGSGTGGKSIIPTLYHILAFFSLSLFLLISITKGKSRSLMIPAVVIAILYSISDEIHQFFVPGRYASGFDVFLDSLGVLFAFMIYFISLEVRN